MGCKQVKVNPSDPAKDNELETVQSTVSQPDIIQTTAASQAEEQLPVSDVNPPSVPAPASHTLTNTYASEQSATRPKSTASTIVNSNGGDNALIEDISSKFGLLSPTPDDSTEMVVYRQNILRRPPSNVNMSDFPEDSSMSIKSNDSQESYLHPRSFVSSTENAEVRAHGQYAIHRFISARPNRANNQESTHHGNWSEQDESYSLRDSLASTASADSEGSVVDLPRGTKARQVHLKNSNVKQNAVRDDISSDSDGSDLQHVTDTNSMTIDVHEMTERLVSNLRSASTKLSNRDLQSRAAISETTSESDEK